MLVSGTLQGDSVTHTHTHIFIFQIPFHCCCCCSGLSCLTLRDPMDRSTLGFTVPHHLPEFAQIMPTDSVMPSNHLILCRPLLLLPSVFPSIRLLPG